MSCFVWIITSILVGILNAKYNDTCPDKFPDKVPSLKYLSNICNNLKEFYIHHASECNTKNCHECIPPNSKWMKKENEEVGNFLKMYKDNIPKRRKEISKLLSHVKKGETIIFMIMNYGYAYLFYNWVCSVQFNSIQNVQNRTLVMYLDDKTGKLIEKAGFIGYHASYLEDFLERIPKQAARSFALGAHKYTVSLQIGLVNDLINMGYNVILQDVDVVWMKSPFNYLNNKIFDRLDVQMSVDGRNDHKGPGNSGFIYIKSNCKTKVFMNTMVELTALIFVGRSDQIVWNMVLNEKYFRQIHFETLDVNYFVAGYQANVKTGRQNGKITLPSTGIMFHASWTTDQFDKVEKYYLSGNWYFTQEKCPTLYDYELLPNLEERRSVIREKQGEQEAQYGPKGLNIFRDTSNGNWVRVND